MLGNFFSSVYTKEPAWTWVLDKEEIRSAQILSEIKANKSLGLGTMHPRMVKEMVDLLVNTFYQTLNQARENTDGVETSKLEWHLQKRR